MNERDPQSFRNEKQPPLSASWISDDLLAETKRLWSKAYGRPISQDEAIEILQNVKRLAEALLKAKMGIKEKEVGKGILGEEDKKPKSSERPENY